MAYRNAADTTISNVFAQTRFDHVSCLTFGGQSRGDELGVGVFDGDVFAYVQNAGDVGVFRQLGRDRGGFGQDLVQGRAAVDVHGARERFDRGDAIISRGTEAGRQQVGQTFLAGTQASVRFAVD